MFEPLFSWDVSFPQFLLCELSALVFGLLTAWVFTRRERHSGAYTQTLVLLPPVVCLVIMMVNGNIGAGLGVAGTFALVRFRSAPGTAKEILGLFFSVALGLACGIGCVGYALVFFVIVGAAALLLERFRFGEPTVSQRHLKITVPETVDYEGLFEDLLDQYTLYHKLDRVRTTNMGTLYELSYSVELREPSHTRAFLDAIRCRNGNLNVVLSRHVSSDMM